MKYIAGAVLLILTNIQLYGQASFFDINAMQDIKLTFFQSNWDQKLDSLKNANEEAYLLAKSVEINGELFDSVGVKYKGNSSYNANNAKNPLHIELDYVKSNQDYKGLKDIKLGNGFADPSFVREALSYEILRQYMEAPRANFAKLSINGTYWGVYSNVESINKRFIEDRFGTDGENPFFKCNPASIGGPGSTNGRPDLVYINADSASYYTRYELKSDYGWKELINLMDTLKNNPAKLDKILDIDKAIWMIAFNNVLVNLDSYTGAFAQNYYLYMDNNGRFMPIVWDLNMSFGGFPLLSSGGGTGALSIAQMKAMDPLAQSSNATRPLIQKILANPTWKRMYIAHVRTILKENFADNTYSDRAVEIQMVIDSAVQADTKKFSTYANFLSNINTTVAGTGAPGGAGTPGITDLMNGRHTFLTTNALLTAVPPTIGAIDHSPAIVPPATMVNFTVSVQNAQTVLLGYRYKKSQIFQKIQLLDDGQHQDGAANDGVYGGAIFSDSTKIQYYVYAENNDAGFFLPERAEFEYFTLEITHPVPASGEVVINEFLASNTSGATDEAGQYEDWLELYNNSDSDISLAALYLSDDETNLDRWQFPTSALIPANGFYIVWLDDDPSQGPAHANFKLTSAGETIVLSDGISNILDKITFGAQAPDISYGRFPNGTGPFTFMPVTFNANNSVSATHSPSGFEQKISLMPNPASNSVFIQSDNELGNVQIFNALGVMVAEQAKVFSNATNLDIRHLPKGIFWVKCGNGGCAKLVKS